MMESAEVKALQTMFGDPNIWTEPIPGCPHSPQPEAISATAATTNAIMSTNADSVTGAQASVGLAHLDSSSDSEFSIPKVSGQLPRAKVTHKRIKPTTAFTKKAKAGQKSFPETGLRLGDYAAPTESFCPWRVVNLYPESYVRINKRPLVKPYFVRDALTTHSAWDFFYIHPGAISEKPILLVPTAQLVRLLDRINNDLGITLSIPVGIAAARFSVKLSKLQPRFLGRSHSLEDFNRLKTAIPKMADVDDPENMSLQARADFEGLISSLQEAQKSKMDRRARQLKSLQTRVSKRRDWGRLTKRVQRYLGLRQQAPAVETLENTRLRQKLEKSLDVNRPAPYEMERDVVFVSLDNETYERDNWIVTEVGLAFLDTRDLHGIAPGEGASNWTTHIKAHHLRVKEYLHLVNTRFVRGCPDKFLFGKSEILSKHRIRRRIQQLLPPADRVFILTGHDVKGDIQTLKELDFDFYRVNNLLEIADNQLIQQRRRKASTNPGLESVLLELGLPHSYLHNAANDAVFTLQALLCACVRVLQPLPEVLKEPSKEAEEEEDEEKGWTSGLTDGEGPVMPVDPKPDRR